MRCLLLALLAFPPAQSAEPTFDLVIRNGRIVDGTGNPWFRGDVGIVGERIARIGRLPAGSGKIEIDAAEKVVAPGFVDIHSHSDLMLLEDGNAPSKIRQGVTTEVLGEGNSAGPYRQAMKSDGRTRFESLGAYYARLEKSGSAVNVASYVGLDNLWQCVMGTSHDRPTEQQFQKMEQILAEAMKDGAIGLSTMLMMPPGSLANTDDLIRLCKVVARHGGSYSSHIRSEGDTVFESIREAIRIGEQADIPVDIIHLKIAEQKLWGRMKEIITLIESARARGFNVQANVYPYTRGNNNLASIIPPWAHEGGTGKMLERLRDPALRPRLKDEIQKGIPGWYNHYTAVGGDWSRMLVSGRGSLSGLTMDRVMSARKKDRPDAHEIDLLLELLIEAEGSIPTVFEHHTEADMNLALQQPWCSIGSDGSAFAIEGPLRRGHPHPRNFGTFPRVLGRYVREKPLLTLEDAVRKMTSLNAAKIGLADRGLLREGTFADVTIFDPATIIDKSTYSDPFQYNEGIVYVLVNGTMVLREGQPTGARPGKALRRPGP